MSLKKTIKSDVNIINILNNLKGKYWQNFSLKNQCWFKVGGKAEYFCIPQDEDDIKQLLKELPTTNNITILGAGSNVLIRDKGVEGIVLKLQNFNTIKIISNARIEVGCGVLNVTLANFAKDNNIGNLEFISGIPGSIGGGIAMNAGCFGSEFKDIVESVKAVDYEGNIVTLTNQSCNFSYRKSDPKVNLVFLSCILNGKIKPKVEIVENMDKIKNEREYSQPKKVLTGGSTFANPKNVNNYKAWQLIDKIGFRGYRKGGAYFSEKHCNFIINDGTASAQDIEDLILEAQNKVKSEFGVEMKPEIKIIGLK